MGIDPMSLNDTTPGDPYWDPGHQPTRQSPGVSPEATLRPEKAHHFRQGIHGQRSTTPARVHLRWPDNKYNPNTTKRDKNPHLYSRGAARQNDESRPIYRQSGQILRNLSSGAKAPRESSRPDPSRVTPHVPAVSAYTPRHTHRTASTQARDTARCSPPDIPGGEQRPDTRPGGPVNPACPPSETLEGAVPPAHNTA